MSRFGTAVVAALLVLAGSSSPAVGQAAVPSVSSPAPGEKTRGESLGPLRKAAAQSLRRSLTDAEARVLGEVVLQLRPLDLFNPIWLLDPKAAMPRTLGADFVTWLCTSTDLARVLGRTGIHVDGYRIEGHLDLSTLELPVMLRMERCLFQGDVNLTRSTCRGLSLAGSLLQNLLLTDAVVESALILGDGFEAQSVNLERVRVRGNLDLKYARLTGAPDGVVLLGAGADISGSVILQSLGASGTVSFAAAKVGGDFIASGKTVLTRNQHGAERVVLDCTNSVISGSVRVDGMKLLASEPFVHMECGGTMDFSRSQIRGDFNLSGVNFSAIGLQSLVMEDASIGGSLQMNNPRMKEGLKASGEVSFARTTVGKSLKILGEHTFSKPGGVALSLESMQVKGDSLLTGFTAYGELCLRQAMFEGKLEISDAKLGDAERMAIDAEKVTVAGELLLGASIQATGETKFSKAHLKSDVTLGESSTWGEFDLSRAEIKGSLSIGEPLRADLVFERNVNLSGTFIGENLFIRRVRIPRGNLNAEDCKVTGEVFLGWVKAYESIYFIGASLSSLSIGNSSCSALQLSGMKIIGGVGLTEISTSMAVILYGSSIGGSLDISDLAFTSVENVTSNAASPMLSIGSESTENTAKNVENKDGGGIPLLLGHTKIAGECSLTRVNLGKGSAMMQNITVGGPLRMEGVAFSHTGNVEGLLLNNAHIKGDVTLAAYWDSKRKIEAPLHIRGGISMHRATIEGSLNVLNGTITSREGTAIYALLSHFHGGVLILPEVVIDGEVMLAWTVADKLISIDPASNSQLKLDLSGAKTGNFWIPEHPPIQQGSLSIDGFMYDGLIGKSNINAKALLAYLDLQDPDFFYPQPYEQLAKVLRTSGYDGAAREVMVAKNRKRGEHTSLLTVEGLWFKGFGHFIDFGYKPWRVFFTSVSFILFSAGIFYFAYRHQLFTPTKDNAWQTYSVGGYRTDRKGARMLVDHYPRFHSLIYALESFIPLLRLDQGAHWMPNPTRGHILTLPFKQSITTGALLRGYLWFHIICGWVLTTLWVGGLTGLTRA